jgi:hypothetical protein
MHHKQLTSMVIASFSLPLSVCGGGVGSRSPSGVVLLCDGKGGDANCRPNYVSSKQLKY